MKLLQFRHDCQNLGCAKLACNLCKLCQRRRCEGNFAAKYLAPCDVVEAKCGAQIYVVVVDSSTGQLVQQGLDDTFLQIGLIDGRKFAQLGGSLEAVDSCLLLLNKQGQPLLAHGRSGTYTDDKRIIIPMIRGQAILPDLKITDSSEALLTGRAPPFCLVVRGVRRTGDVIPDMVPSVSEPFVVATARVKGAAKAEIPHLDDHVSKIECVGVQTQKKLEDIRAASAAANIPDLHLPVNSVTKVGQFRDLVELAERSKPLRENLKQVLRLTKGWDYARDHVRRAVDTDTQLRAYCPDGRNDVGLVFKCAAFNVVDMNHPLGLLRRKHSTEDRNQELVDIIWLPRDLNACPEAVRKILPQASSEWWREGHPGWSFLPLTTQHAPVHNELGQPSRPASSFSFTLKNGPGPGPVSGDAAPQPAYPPAPGPPRTHPPPAAAPAAAAAAASLPSGYGGLAAVGPSSNLHDPFAHVQVLQQQQLQHPQQQQQQLQQTQQQQQQTHLLPLYHHPHLAPQLMQQQAAVFPPGLAGSAPTAAPLGGGIAGGQPGASPLPPAAAPRYATAQAPLLGLTQGPGGRGLVDQGGGVAGAGAGLSAAELAGVFRGVPMVGPQGLQQAPPAAAPSPATSQTSTAGLSGAGAAAVCAAGPVSQPPLPGPLSTAGLPSLSDLPLPDMPSMDLFTTQGLAALDAGSQGFPGLPKQDSASPFEDPAFQNLMALVAANNPAEGGAAAAAVPPSKDGKPKRKAETSLDNWVAMHKSLELDISLPPNLAQLSSLFTSLLAGNDMTPELLKELLPHQQQKQGQPPAQQQAQQQTQGVLAQQAQQPLSSQQPLQQEQHAQAPLSGPLGGGLQSTAMLPGHGAVAPSFAQNAAGALEMPAGMVKQEPQQGVQPTGGPLQARYNGELHGCVQPSETNSRQGHQQQEQPAAARAGAATSNPAQPSSAAAAALAGVSLEQLQHMFQAAARQEISYEQLEGFLRQHNLLPASQYDSEPRQ